MIGYEFHTYEIRDMKNVDYCRCMNRMEDLSDCVWIKLLHQRYSMCRRAKWKTQEKTIGVCVFVWCHQKQAKEESFSAYKLWYCIERCTRSAQTVSNGSVWGSVIRSILFVVYEKLDDSTNYNDKSILCDSLENNEIRLCFNIQWAVYEFLFIQLFKDMYCAWISVLSQHSAIRINLLVLVCVCVCLLKLSSRFGLNFKLLHLIWLRFWSDWNDLFMITFVSQ